MAYHPKAFLRVIRNIRPGLETRTAILTLLEEKPLTASEIAERTGLSYGAVLEHLRHLEEDGIVARAGEKRPYRWRLTGRGQQRITDFSSPPA
ncbi:MAG: hypothetical protein DRN20_05305 [Thermoplasmata archaeon]|nr:MAG: hypothetical protein DRN20_05305 [Thermoplasmata archaeon]